MTEEQLEINFRSLKDRSDKIIERKFKSLLKSGAINISKEDSRSFQTARKMFIAILNSVRNELLAEGMSNIQEIDNMENFI